MTLFIQNGNIRIIWDVISMCPLFSKTFPTELSQREWFNQIIGRLNKQIDKNITMEELGNINRNAIKVMMANLKEHYLKVSTDIESRDRPSAIDTNTDSPYMRRQTEYDTMKSVYIPPQIDFRSIEIDVPITNMSELVERHLNERNKTMDIRSLDTQVNKTEKHSECKNVSWTTPIETFYSLDDSSRDMKNETHDESFVTIDKKIMKNTTNVGQTIMNTLDNLNRKIDTFMLMMSPITNKPKTIRTRSNSI